MTKGAKFLVTEIFENRGRSLNGKGHNVHNDNHIKEQWRTKITTNYSGIDLSSCLCHCPAMTGSLACNVLGPQTFHCRFFSALPSEMAYLLECWGRKMLYLWRAHYSPSFNISPSWCYHHGHGIGLASSSISHENFWQPMAHLFYISSPKIPKKAGDAIR